MKVPTYQIQKIIRVYIKQLIQSESDASHSRQFGEKFLPDRIPINIKEKCRVIIDNITSDLMERTTNLRLNEKLHPERLVRFKEKSHKQSEFNQAKNSEFIFYTVDKKNEKIKSRIPVNDARFLLEKLERLMRKPLIET